MPDGCENCTNYVFDLTNNTITEDTSAQIGIQSNGKIIVGAVVNYHAGSYVELVTDFEVELGATFSAFIQSCN